MYILSHVNLLTDAPQYQGQIIHKNEFDALYFQLYLLTRLSV